MASVMTLAMNSLEAVNSSKGNDDENVDEDDEEFEDAEGDTIKDEPPVNSDMTFIKSLEESQKAIDYFFNNQFTEAKHLMAPHADSSMYHALGNAVFLFLEAILTFEQTTIATASKALKHAMLVCNGYRKKNTFGESLGKIVKKVNFEQYSEQEAHAELCYAECLLLRSLLTFIEDETLSSFIKGGIKIRSCYNSYKDCQQILLKRSWHQSKTREHFESGVKMGIGTFNLMISLLPARVIKLLEFLGFSGNKVLGLEDLHKGYEMNGLRRILCMMTLLAYNLIVLHVLSHKEGDTKTCHEILQRQISKHPNGVWFLFFKGRLELLKGNLDESKRWYIKSWHSQNLWTQFHHVVFWELVWLHCLKAEWREALEYCTELINKNKWSKSLYSYQKAVIMCMCKENLTEAEIQEMNNLMRDVPKYKQRIAGKSLPMEKFAIKKSERYFEQNEMLVLPVIELMFLWNLFKIFKYFHIATGILKIIEKALVHLNSSSLPTKYDTDNRALILLLKGACLRHIGSPLQALECLEVVISLQKNILEDHYLVPYAIVELALIEWTNGNREKAILALEDVRKNYTGYSLESRLHFRIHTAINEIKAEMMN